MDFRQSWIVGAVAALTLSGCWVDELDGDGKKSATTQPDPPAAVNHAPTITGLPAPTIVAGEFYEFIPDAADADGDTLEFSISRKPVWADFNHSTGRLSGTPQDADVGNFTNIAITVSDGQKSRTLAAFNITVDAIALGAVTLSWNPPTQNSDGSPLTDLAGYRIYYGRDPNVLGRSVALTNPGLTSYVVENLQSGLWYFVMTSINAQGVESPRTDLVSKSIS